MIGIITAWSFAFFLAAIFQCGIDWQLNWAPVGEFLSRCPNTMNTPPAFAVTDVLTDIVIIGMPIPQIWRLHMSVKRRIGITSVFLVGIFAIAAGVARMYIYMGASYDTEDNPDFIGKHIGRKLRKTPTDFPSRCYEFPALVNHRSERCSLQ